NKRGPGPFFLLYLNKNLPNLLAWFYPGVNNVPKVAEKNFVALGSRKKMNVMEIRKFDQIIDSSDLISRDLSWLKFNERVFDQAKKHSRSIFDKLKFLAITASNL